MCTSRILHILGIFTNEFSHISGFRRGWPIRDKIQWSDTRYVAYMLAKRPDERDWRSRPEKWELWKVSNVVVSEYQIEIEFKLLLSVKKCYASRRFHLFLGVWFLSSNWGGVLLDLLKSYCTVVGSNEFCFLDEFNPDWDSVMRTNRMSDHLPRMHKTGQMWRSGRI